MSKGLGILPCAGLGTRMGMPFTQSKEMLIDPVTNQPLIQWHIDYLKKYDLQPHIITRKEKLDLIEYCYKQGCSIQVIEPTGEWPNTIHASQSNWLDFNVVLFPDSKFSTAAFIPTAQLYMTDEFKAKMVYGIHEVTDASKWCVISPETDCVYEKSLEGPADAIVCFAFNKTINPKFFRELNDFRTTHQEDWLGVLIHNYHDLTRTGKIETIKV